MPRPTSEVKGIGWVVSDTAKVIPFSYAMIFKFFVVDKSNPYMEILDYLSRLQAQFLNFIYNQL